MPDFFFIFVHKLLSTWNPDGIIMSIIFSIFRENKNSSAHLHAKPQAREQLVPFLCLFGTTWPGIKRTMFWIQSTHSTEPLRLKTSIHISVRTTLYRLRGDRIMIVTKIQKTYNVTMYVLAVWNCDCYLCSQPLL